METETEPKTAEEILQIITAARDSVWEIEDTIARLAAGEMADDSHKGNLERNVEHLKIVVADEEIANSGNDISDLTAAIAAGEAKLAEDIWPAE